jgi:hypothetical protein
LILRIDEDAQRFQWNTLDRHTIGSLDLPKKHRLVGRRAVSRAVREPHHVRCGMGGLETLSEAEY